jgi:hypothetical protein
MNTLARNLSAIATSAMLVLPQVASAKDNLKVSCSVTVDYTLNGGAPEAYRKDFSVSPGVGFIDDFSTALRQKEFRASAAREGGNVVVSIDYFNDVGVFHSVGFSTRMNVRENRVLETTAGSNTFSTSLGVSGNHRTDYTLTCRRL